MDRPRRYAGTHRQVDTFRQDMLGVLFQRLHLIIALEQRRINHPNRDEDDIMERFLKLSKHLKKTVLRQLLVSTDQNDCRRFVWIKFAPLVRDFRMDMFEGFRRLPDPLGDTSVMMPNRKTYSDDQ